MGTPRNNPSGSETDGTAPNQASSVTIWMIGHGSAELPNLIDLLRSEGVNLLVDVRSTPYSKYVPQANREILEQALPRAGLSYLFMGDVLGGRPEDPGTSGPDEKPNYAAIAEADFYQRGIARLVELAGAQRVCCMCSEEDPSRCHRAKLIAPTLISRGHRVMHIRHDGAPESHETMELRKSKGQLSLF